MLLLATGKAPAPATQAAPGSSAGSRLGSAAVETEDMETRLAALEAQHGIETPVPSRGGSRVPSAAGSRVPTGRSGAAQSAARSMLGTPARPLTNSQSAPLLVLELEPSLPVISEINHTKDTRAFMYRRAPGGNFLKDAPNWSSDCQPVLPSRHRYISSALWMSTNPNYKLYGEESDYMANLVDHKLPGAPVRAFMNPRDKNTIYNEEKFKFGNQCIMRKNKGVPKKE